MQLIRTYCVALALCLPSAAFSLSDLGNLRPSLLEGDAKTQTEILTRNDTFDILDAEGRATAYVGKVMIVDMARCTNELPESKFYKGLMVNTYGYKASSSCIDYTSYRLGKDSETTSSTWGTATPAKTGKPYHTWEWLQFPNGRDIRTSELEVEFRAWNALPQFYFPLLSPTDAKIGGKFAYMIYVKPNAALLNNSAFYNYYGDCAYNRNPIYVSCGIATITNKRMLWTINIANLIRNIRTDLTIDALLGYTYKGVELEVVGGTHTLSNSYDDVNQLSLIPTYQGNAGENLCGWYMQPLEDQDILMLKIAKVITWL